MHAGQVDDGRTDFPLYGSDSGCEVAFGWHCSGMTGKLLWRQPMLVLCLKGMDASVGAGSSQLALGDMQEFYLPEAYVGHTP